MNMRMNAGYIITDSVRVGESEFVLGVNTKAPSQFVTWACADGKDYYWGHYFSNMYHAQKDLVERAQKEIEILDSRDKPIGMDMEERSNLFAIVENGDNRVLIQFPTNQLSDKLRSIGIVIPPEQVEICGTQYKVYMKSNAQDKTAEKICNLLGGKDTLQLVNDLTRAVYNTDSRVFNRIQKELSENKYGSANEVLKAASEMIRQMKSRSKECER